MTNLADGVAVVAWGWVASLLTRDALLVALVPVALRLPWFLFALPAGIVTDRVDRRRLILAMDAVRAAGLCRWRRWRLGWRCPWGWPRCEGVSDAGLYATILMAGLVVGGAEVFRDNAAQTMLPALVPRERLERANGRLWSVELLTNSLIGPALGAFLIALWLPLPFALNAAGLRVGDAFGLRACGEFPGSAGPTGGVGGASWREGFSFLRASPLLRTLAWTTGFWNLFHQMIVIALVLHAQENLGLWGAGLWVVLAGGAVGGIVGQSDGRADRRGAGTGADDAGDAGDIGARALRRWRWHRGLDAGCVFAVLEFSGLGLEHRIGQHAAADDTGCDAGAGEQPLPAAGLGDDAGGAGPVGAGGVAGRGLWPRETALVLAVLGGGVGSAVSHSRSGAGWRADLRG